MSDKSRKKKKTETAPEAEQETVQAAEPETSAEPEAVETPEVKEEPKAAETPTPEALLAAEKDKYLRLLAEYDNFRRRSQKEKEGIYTDVRFETLKRFLPVFDSLTRALTTTPEDDPARKGLEMIMTQFENALSQLGVSQIEAVGKPFDANLHNAVMHVEDESVGENVIVEEFERGFKIGDKVLRYSVVKVAN